MHGHDWDTDTLSASKNHSENTAWKIEMGTSVLSPPLLGQEPPSFSELSDELELPEAVLSVAGPYEAGGPSTWPPEPRFRQELL